MTQTTAPQVTYRKTKAGQWVAFGPVDALTPGRTVTVTKKSGETKTETIDRVGKSFAVDGRIMAYGYLRPTSRTATSGSTRTARIGGRMCDECGERRATTTAVDLSGIVGDVCGRCKRDEGCLSFA
jgi:hypothetical protein